jgi:hypothetical protein
MKFKRTILGGAAAAMLVSSGLLVTAGAASALPPTGNGQQQCNSLFWNLSSDQDTLHYWQLQRASETRQGLSASFADSEIDFYFAQIDQDVQALTDVGC